MSGSELIQVDAPAPDFTLEGSTGATYRLSEELRRGHVALIFYPGNNTPG